MTTISTENLLTQLNWRYAVKRFDASKKIPADQWKSIEDVLVLSPSSYGLQPYKFLVIENSELRKKLRTVSWNQSQIEDASHLVVMLGRQNVSKEYIEDYVQNIVNTRQVQEKDVAAYKDMMMGNVVNGPLSKNIPHWAAKQVYIALGNLLTSAAVLGIDACPLEGLDPLQYDEILDLNSTPFRTLVVCALGYRHAEDTYANLKKVRTPKRELIEHR